MLQYKALILNSDRALTDKLKPSAAFPFIFNQTTSPDELWRSLSKEEPDVIVLHLDLPNASGAKLVHRLRELRPQIPALLVLSRPKKSDWDLLDDRLDLVRAPFDLLEIQHRLCRLLNRPEKSVVRSSNQVVDLVADIHNPDSGRIDAKRIADHFGLSLSELARILKREISTLHKTPDAVALQPKLAPFVRIASALIKLTGSLQAIKIWLNAPNSKLDGTRPIEILKKGKQELIADMLEDAQTFQPARYYRNKNKRKYR